MRKRGNRYGFDTGKAARVEHAATVMTISN